MEDIKEIFQRAAAKEEEAHQGYVKAQTLTRDPGARHLMVELAQEELKHKELVLGLAQKGPAALGSFKKEAIPNLQISEYLAGGSTLSEASFQDTLIFAMKREEQAQAFYAQAARATSNREAQHLLELLAQEEQKHKLRLETIYDEVVLKEN